MELEAFYPRPALVTKTTLVEKPRFPAIYAHNQLQPCSHPHAGTLARARPVPAGPILFVIFLLLASCRAQEAQDTPTALEVQPASPAVAQITPAATTDKAVWQPAPGITWQWQLTDLPVDTSVEAEVYDIDLFDNDASVVAALHAQGRKVICYISAGSWEDWRPDKDQFPPEIIGKAYEGWPGEKWLDIRQVDKLAPILRARLDLCRDIGFDGVEPDNIDAYTNDTGFPLTYQDQLHYNIWLADEAHARGLSIGLKNDSDQAADLLPHFDWALTEDCFDQGWCEQMIPFIKAGKAVIDAEYTDTGITLEDFCSQAQALQFSAILKHRDLDAFILACP